MASLTNTAVAVGTSPTLLAASAANVGTGRSVLGISNTSAVTVYIGGSSVTASNGVAIPAGSNVWFYNDHPGLAASFPWYAVVATGSQNIPIVEAY